MSLFSSKKDILNGNVIEQITIFTMPLVGSYLLQQLYSFVDSIVLGRYVGTIALAAIGPANSILNMILNFIGGIAAGTMVVVAQSYGSGNVNKVKQTVKTGMFIAVVFGAVLTLGMNIFAKPLLHLIGCPDETIPDACTYLRIYALSFIPYLIYSIGNYIFRATGDNKRSIMFTIIIAVVKIVLDLLLSAVLKLGILGVSLATALAHLTCAIVVLVIFQLTPDIYQYSITSFGCDKESLKKILKIGMPAGIQSMLFAISNVFVQAKINSYGTNVIAGFSAYNSVDNLYWCFANAIGSAIITLIGQNYGNKNMDRVRAFVKYGFIIGVLGSSLIAILITIFGRYILLLFTSDENVLEIARRMIWSVAVTYPIYPLNEIISGCLKGCGDATQSMIITMFTICVLRILYILLIDFKDVIQVLNVYGISWAISGICFFIYYLINKKYKRNKAV